MADSFATRMQQFNRSLKLKARLPENIEVLNPFQEPFTLQCADTFYEKFYQDNEIRYGIFGINPGRFGGGLTGVPFTDFKRMQENCGIDVEGRSSNEPSSYFIYRMIAALGDVDAFYRHFYINSVCPLGFTISKTAGRFVNYNYYDDPALYTTVKPFMVKTMRQQIKLGLHTDTCFCLGKKNLLFFNRLNEEHLFFKKIIELPHPRFVVQYRYKMLDTYVDEYCEKLTTVLNT